MDKVKNTILSVANKVLVFVKKAFTKISPFITKFSSNRKNLIIAGSGLAVIVIIVFAGLFIPKTLFSSKTNNSGKIEISPPKATLELNKEYSFPLRDKTGKTVSNIKYIIESAQKQDEIVVKGQIAKSVKGRTFLILNLKIVNDFDKEIQIQTSDYVRLSVNGNKTDWLAADAHNDPVTIQAISVKQVKIGFAINESDQDLILRIGEIKGDKTELPIKFK